MPRETCTIPWPEEVKASVKTYKQQQVLKKQLAEVRCYIPIHFFVSKPDAELLQISEWLEIEVM